MFVKNHLIPISQVTTLNATDSLHSALKIMDEHKHDALPVLDENKQLVGLLSKQHVYKVFFMKAQDKEVFLNTTSAGTLMKTDYKYVYEDALIETAIKLMTNMRMQFIVVYNSKNQFVGILTRRNLLEAMANALGIDKKGVRVEVVVNDTQGRLAALTKVLAKAGYNIMSIFMLDPNVMDLQKIVLRLDTKDEKRVVTLLNDSGFKVLTSVLE
ncbi:MAG TPA: CBS domain-containing protein [Candidatus Deferrimicrobium sp.]|nr:CBS domain-containing protein [Candidatus Deferrimicrobium sp.]